MVLATEENIFIMCVCVCVCDIKSEEETSAGVPERRRNQI